MGEALWSAAACPALYRDLAIPASLRDGGIARFVQGSGLATDLKRDKSGVMPPHSKALRAPNRWRQVSSDRLLGQQRLINGPRINTDKRRLGQQESAVSFPPKFPARSNA